MTGVQTCALPIWREAKFTEVFQSWDNALLVQRDQMARALSEAKKAATE